MNEVYMGCLIFGLLLAFVTVILGDFLSIALDGALDFLSADWLNGTTIGTAVTGFGGSGLMFERATALQEPFTALVSGGIGVIAALAIQLFVVNPMRRSEMSSGYSEKDLTGSIAEVITAVPASGCGEILLRAGAAGVTNMTAASMDGTPIENGAKVVVVEIKEGTAWVTRF